MLEVYSSNQTVASNSPLTFSSVALDKGEVIMLLGSGSIQLNKCGVYAITLDIGAQPEAGDFAIIMTKNGVAQPQFSIAIPNVIATVGVSGSCTTLVQVPTSNTCKCCSIPTVIQFVNSGVAFSDGTYNLTVRKLC